MEFSINLNFSMDAENEKIAKEKELTTIELEPDFVSDNIQITKMQDNELLNDELLKLKGYIISSSYREKVIEVLFTNQYGLMPKQIAQECDIKVNHISKTLSELVDNGLIRCINPEMRKGRIYQLTMKGEDVQHLI